MKIELSKDWCLQMARLEIESGADLTIGGTASTAVSEVGSLEASSGASPDLNIAFGRFVRLMRRQRRQTLERLAEDAEVEITELVEIEEDNHHRPEPRTVYQLANHFKVPMKKMMQLAGLSVPKDSNLYEEAIRFAARSEPVEELNDNEKAALEAFVSVLSEKS
jgi:HTH-type transcriptional regulator, competence development regulator